MGRLSTVDRASSSWRVFYTYPRAEKKCEDLLYERRIEVFLPKRTVVRQWTYRKKKVVEPLFRNYIFARVSERERVTVLSTPGIVRCLAFGGVLAEVSQGEIEQLKFMQAHPEWLEPVEAPPPEVGAVVTIDSGPLRGLKGEVIEHRGSTRLIVRISSIEQAIRIDLPVHLVGPNAVTIN